MNSEKKLDYSGSTTPVPQPASNRSERSNGIPPPSIPSPKTLDELVLILRQELGKDGIDSKDVNVERIKQIMENYDAKCDRANWEKYVFLDEFRYTRNLIDVGNGNYNLILLCWNVNHQSPIHNHNGSHCLAKVMEGCLTETLYEWPKECGKAKGNEAPLQVTQETNMPVNEVAYIHDKIGLHRIANKQSSPAMSLHLYSPPIEVCKTFCEKTSASNPTAKCCFYSKWGKKVDNVSGCLDAIKR